MVKKFFPFISKFLGLDHFESLKTVLLGAMYFCLVGAYSVLRPLKTSVFFKLVGVTYQPYTKILMLVIIFPIMYFYALLIDKVKRENIVHAIFIGYAFTCFLFAYLLCNPITGLPNTETSPYRLLGWLFYIAMDLFSPLIMTTFWSFTNAINTPNSARDSYGLITATSRIGGLLCSSAVYYWLDQSLLDATVTVPIIVIVCGGLLCIGSLCTFLITLFIPEKHLGGYKPEETAEILENNLKNNLSSKSESNKLSFTQQIVSGLKNNFEGLRLLLSNSYVFGIFALVYGFEIISSIFDYQMQLMMVLENNNSIKESSLFMLRYTMLFQIVGLFSAVFGISPLLKRWGVRICLALTPIITMGLMSVTLTYNSLAFLTTMMVILRGLNYGFNVPIREILFIPTSHDIRYKAKAWIESAGRTFSKTSGALVNISSQQAAASAMALSTAFSFSIAAAWFIIALLLGKKYQEAVKNNKVIGRDA
jgi:AAA family ATP:ADP antiporter